MKNKLNEIVFYDEGICTGIPLVFLHGFPFTHEMWKFQIEKFSASRRVISPDLRGHGESGVGDGQYTIELFVDDLIRILDHLEIQKVILCGLSMGGYIALRTAERHPERLAGLVLCDTKSEADANEAKIKRAGAMQTVKTKGVEVFAGDFIKSVLTEASLQDTSEIRKFVLGLILKNSALGIAGALLAMAARVDTTASLSKIHVPTLLLVGEEDRLTPPAASEAMAQKIPSAEIHRIPSAGHLSNIENKEFFNTQLAGFLQKNFT